MLALTEMNVYWITRLDGFQAAASVIGALGTLAALIFLIVSIVFWYEEENAGMFKTALPLFFVPLLLILGSLFIPTTKEMCAIKAIPMIVNNEEVQEIPDKVLELATEWIEGLRPNSSTSQTIEK